MKVHKGPLATHPQQRHGTTEVPLTELLKTDPYQYLARLPAKPGATQADVDALAQRCLEHVRRACTLAGDTLNEGTLRAWTTRMHASDPWTVNVIGYGTKSLNPQSPPKE